MVKPRTDEERQQWEAKAALLGLMYLPMGHYFYDPEVPHTQGRRFDAETMREFRIVKDDCNHFTHPLRRVYLDD